MMQNSSPSPYQMNSPSPNMYHNMPSPASTISTVYSPGPVDSMNLGDSMSTSSSGNQPRQRLRPWLTDQINEGKIPGLEWLNKDQLIFKISWKHFGRPGVDEYNDAMLFRKWAEHTKKWQEGQPTDISTWKTRFRCALTKLQDIVELNQLHQTEGEDPYRVYQFKKKDEDTAQSPVASTNDSLNLPRNTINTMGQPQMFMGDQVYRPNENQNFTPNQCSGGMVSSLDIPDIDPIDPLDMNISDIIGSDTGFNSPNPSNISSQSNNANSSPQMSTLHTQNFSNSRCASCCVNDKIVKQFMEANNGNILKANVLDKRKGEVGLIVLVRYNAMTSDKNNTVVLNNELIKEKFRDRIRTLTSLHVKLFYGSMEVGNQIVDSPRGLRIAFNPPPPLPDDVVRQEASEVVSHIYGPFQAEQIYFPATTDQNTIRLLECIKRGLVLQARNGEILATRLCRAKVFYSDSVSPTQEPKELPREHTTVVFDYANDFLPKFRSYMLGQGPLPSTETYFSFGQKCSESLPLKNIFIYVGVTHLYAQKQINHFRNQRPDILVSDPNMLDMIANQIEELSITSGGNIMLPK